MKLITCKNCDQQCVKISYESMDYRGNIYYRAKCKLYGEKIISKDEIISEIDLGDGTLFDQN